MRRSDKNGKMRIIFIAAFCAVLAGGFFLGRGSPTALAQAYAQGGILRLHILANSNSEYDQQTKLAVRDAVIDEFALEIASVDDSRGAENLLAENIPRIIEAAKRAGHEGSVEVQIGDFEFPDRVYGGTLLPAGIYRAVRIILGEGKGDNWWCVMYPPLCFSGEEVSLWKTPQIKFESYLKKRFMEIFISREGDIVETAGK